MVGGGGGSKDCSSGSITLAVYFHVTLYFTCDLVPLAFPGL